MQIKTISCKKVKSLGNYQTETLEAFAEVEEGESPEEAALKLRHFVDESLNKPLNQNKGLDF